MVWRRGLHKRGPRKNCDVATLEEGDAATDDAAGPSSSPNPKRKAVPKTSVEELKRLNQNVAVDVQAVAERYTALKRQCKLAAAQHKRLVEMRVVDE